MPAGCSSPHLDITQWLLILELDQYTNLFQDYGGVEEILHFTEVDVKEMGVKNAGHRTRMVSSLKALAAKYEKGKIWTKIFTFHFQFLLSSGQY